mmetsp:Transcript_5647/g.9734  ORF Transcript_5647/g.9734 Transcript_5647/m.9734 type:complete len:694 (+) Transcript_5647:88-2169(+)
MVSQGQVLDTRPLGGGGGGSHPYPQGSHVQYYSESQHKYLDAQVLQVNHETGEVELDVRPGRWIPLSSCRAAVQNMPTTNVGLRAPSPGVRTGVEASGLAAVGASGRGSPYPGTSALGGGVDAARRGAPVPNFAMLQAGDRVYMYSQSKEKYIPANVLNVDSDGSVELDVKRGCRIGIAEQEMRILRTRIPTNLRIGDEVTFWTETQVTVAKVTNTEPSGAVQLDIAPGHWYSLADQQRQFRVALEAPGVGGRPPAMPENANTHRAPRPGQEASRHPVNALVEYYSATNGYWIPAVVTGHNDNGSYALDVNPQAAPEKVRSRQAHGQVGTGTRLVSPNPGGGGGGGAPHAPQPKKTVHAGGGGDDGNVLEGTIVNDNPNVDWEDIAGLESAKDQLKLAVVLPTKFPKLFSDERPPPKAILMYGPPGTGKTYLAKACATACTSTFFQVKPSDIMSKYQGESEQHVAKLFDLAKERAPSIIFIDEIDALFGKREKDSGGSGRAVKNVFLQSMESFTNASTVGKTCLVLGATNMPWDLDDAFLRRFQAKIYIPLPDVAARAALFRLVLGERKKDLHDRDIDFLVQRTEGFSGSDVKNLTQNAIMKPVRDLQHAKAFRMVEMLNENGHQVPYWVPCDPSEAGARQMRLLDINDGEPYVRPINIDDFEAAMAEVKSSVKENSLQKFEQWTEKYGMQGT